MPELSKPPAGMSMAGMDAWFRSAPGRYVLDWAQARMDETVSDIFGFNALQIGLPDYDFLRANRMPLRARLAPSGTADVICSPLALPIDSQSVDLVVLPHQLEFAQDPHQILREVERLLIPEGQLILLGFNPVSLWGLRRVFGLNKDFPWHGRYLSLPRVKDWLKLLGFEVDRGHFGCYAPPCEQPAWLQRWRLIEGPGARWWPFSGAVYQLRAIKRQPGLRLITPDWRKKPLRAGSLKPANSAAGNPTKSR